MGQDGATQAITRGLQSAAAYLQLHRISGLVLARAYGLDDNVDEKTVSVALLHAPLAAQVAILCRERQRDRGHAAGAMRKAERVQTDARARGWLY